MDFTFLSQKIKIMGNLWNLCGMVNISPATQLPLQSLCNIFLTIIFVYHIDLK